MQSAIKLSPSRRRQIGFLRSDLESRKLSRFTDSNWDWLDHLSASQAFLACIGSGPWILERRVQVQRKALLALDGRDISEISNESAYREPVIFPLAWQNQKVEALVDYLHRKNISFTDFCADLKELPTRKAIRRFYKACGAKSQQVKVLDLFVRDFLKLPSFPVDRHVRAYLLDLDLPDSSVKMVKICKLAGLDPRVVNRSIFGSKSKNPYHLISKGR